MKLEPRQDWRVVIDESIECRLGPIDEIHLTDHDGDVLDAQEAEEVGMTARLLLDTLLRIHQQERPIRVSRTRDHVPDEFLMAGCVDDEVITIAPMEPRLRHIDRDALELLLLEGVQEEGVLEWPASLLTDASGLFDAVRLEGPGVRQ